MADPQLPVGRERPAAPVDEGHRAVVVPVRAPSWHLSRLVGRGWQGWRGWRGWRGWLVWIRGLGAGEEVVQADAEAEQAVEADQ
jgi:hypothetical protein